MKKQSKMCSVDPQTPRAKSIGFGRGVSIVGGECDMFYVNCLFKYHSRWPHVVVHQH